MPKSNKRSLTTWLVTAILLCSLIGVSFAMSKAVVFFRFFSQFNGAVVNPAGLPATNPDPASAATDPALADPSGGPETQPEANTPSIDQPPAAGSNPPAANISPDPANPPSTTTPDPTTTDPATPVPAIPAVPENLAAAAREVSNADKAAAARIIMTKLSSSDLNRLMALAEGELTEEKKGEAIGILQNKLTPEEFELLMALAGKYKELIKRALGK